MITDKIMIMGAMKDVELNLILENLTDTKIYEEATCTFYEGFLFEKDVVVCHCNVGIINASIATFAGIKKYNPTSIFVIGTAGAHRDDIHREELVVATNADFKPFEYQEGDYRERRYLLYKYLGERDSERAKL